MKEVRQAELNDLVVACREQTAHYTQRESYDQSFCYEIWRRAVVERNEAAWQAVFDQYNVYVRRWLVQRLASLPALRFEEEVLINGVFFNFFRFVGPERFGSFNNLPAILQYLKLCCGTLVIDAQRDWQGRQHDSSLDAPLGQGGSDEGNNLGELVPGEAAPDDEAIDRVDRTHFWNNIWQKLPDPTDRLLIYLRYVLDMPPREIIQHYPQHFNDIQQVYRRNKNIIWRLRNAGL